MISADRHSFSRRSWVSSMNDAAGVDEDEEEDRESEQAPEPEREPELEELGRRKNQRRRRDGIQKRSKRRKPRGGARTKNQRPGEFQKAPSGLDAIQVRSGVLEQDHDDRTFALRSRREDPVDAAFEQTNSLRAQAIGRRCNKVCFSNLKSALEQISISTHRTAVKATSQHAGFFSNEIPGGVIIRRGRAVQEVDPEDDEYLPDKDTEGSAPRLERKSTFSTTSSEDRQTSSTPRPKRVRIEMGDARRPAPPKPTVNGREKDPGIVSVETLIN